MKRAEFKNCAWCGKGMAAAGVHFYRARIEMFVLDMNAIRREAGFEMMMGGPALAVAMGPNSDLAHRMAEATVLVCAECSLKAPVGALLREDGADKGSAA